MELFGILFGIVFWPVVIGAWIWRGKKHRWRGPFFPVLAALIALPLLAAVSMGHYLFLDEPLVFAVRDGNAARVRELLAKGASPNADFEGSTALCAAAEQGRGDIVRMLLNAGADPNTRNSSWDNRSALRLAADGGHWRVVKILKAAGATP